jgi:ribosomal protein S20
MKQTEEFLDALHTGDYDKAKEALSSALEDLTTKHMQNIITKESE